ncbi:hypothetical protein D3C78_1602170 [compost metagenome]
MFQLFREHWPRKQEPLFFIHADFIEEPIFAFCFHAFGDHPEFKRFGRRDDGTHQRL